LTCQLVTSTDDSYTAAMRIVVFFNPASGVRNRPISAESLASLFAAQGLTAVVSVVPCESLSECARAAATSGADIVVAAGGDGTVRAVAAGLVDTGCAFGVLPVGTLNHFAKDIGVPLELADAIRTMAIGTRRQVDVGEVNGQLFINNSSIGAYPVMVRGRDRQRQRLGRGKWMAMFLAGLRIFKRFPLFNVRIHKNDGTLRLRTSFVFVGNNRYQVDLFSLGIRTQLDAGEVCLYTSTTQSRWGIVRLAWRALWGRLEQSRDFHHECLQEFVIESRRPKLTVAVDGEVRRIETPLVYRSRRRALSVIVPANAPGAQEGNGARLQ
jgi:diacylglycerol kinase family enzyme